MVKINIELSPGSVKEAIEKLNNLKKALVAIETELPKELAEQTKNKVQQFYTSSVQAEEMPSIGVKENGKSCTVYITGKNVTYEEFGTGDVGSKSPHPRKGEYGLKPYNSGRTIRSTDKLSPDYQSEKGLSNGLYWTYKKNGQKIYTQGIPAGKFMYNASTWLKSNYKKIAKEKVDDALSKL